MGRVLVSVAVVAAALVLVPGPATAERPVVEVKVERTKEKKEKHPTLQFLRTNRAFVRAQLDRLRVARLERDGEADAVAAAEMQHQEMLAAIDSAESALAAEADEVAARDVIERLGDLQLVEEQLARLEGALVDQRQRLRELEDRFVDGQTTAVMMLVTGWSPDLDPGSIILTNDEGDVVRVPISAAETASLQAGGVMQVFHEFVEPRDQAWQVSLADGDADDRFLRLTPTRNRLTFVELDLTTWHDDDRMARAWLDAPLAEASR